MEKRPSQQQIQGQSSQQQTSQPQTNATQQSQPQLQNQVEQPGPAVNASASMQPESAHQDKDKQKQKEKDKQIKLLEAKNKKLQTKYVELFKESKLFKKDWSVLTAIVKIVFNLQEDKPMGKYDIEQLKQAWNQRESAYNRKIQDMKDDMAKEKQRLQKQVSQLAEQRINIVTKQCKDKIQSISKQLQQSKKSSKLLSQHMSDLDKKLDTKTDQLSKITKEKLKLEHQVNQLKMKSITDELQDEKKQMDDKNGLERNQLLMLRHEVGKLMEKRDQLRTQLKSAKQIIDKLKAQNSDKNKEIQALKQKIQSAGEKHQRIYDKVHEKQLQRQKQKKHKQGKLQQKLSLISSGSQSEQSSKKVKKEQKSSQSFQINDSEQNQGYSQSDMHHLSGDDQFIHRQYMKNVFIRYMKSWAKGDATQTEILLNIILTMLKFNTKEKDLIKEKKKGWWGIY